MTDFERFLTLGQELPIEPSSIDIYKRALAIDRVLSGDDPQVVSKSFGISKKWLIEKAAGVKSQGLKGLVPNIDELLEPRKLQRRRLGIGRMLLGKLTEQQFLVTSKQITGGRTLSIEDHVMARTDTDFVLRNGNNNEVCRINIKFHGTLLRKAKDLVGLDPEDCFALATYKIDNALRRQESEALPYVFVVLSIRNLSAESVAERVPEDFVWFLAVTGGKRVLEDAIAEELGSPKYHERFGGILSRIAEGEFRMISAGRANTLLREHLFQRVFALRVPRFNMAYRNAEIDMHLSISKDLTSLTTFLEMLSEYSLQVMNVRLYRGDI